MRCCEILQIGENTDRGKEINATYEYIHIKVPYVKKRFYAYVVDNHFI